MKNELVYIRKNDVFTNSLIIASGTGVEHRKVKDQIRKYETQIKQLGLLASYQAESTGGRPEEYYALNEPQASFLVTLLKNTPFVVEFKLALVKEFYQMRKLLLEKQTADWQQARIAGKSTRKTEMDVIRDKLIPLAIDQGSKNYSKFYMTYSKLVNSVLKINSDMRDSLPYHYITTIDMLERIIENIISAEVDKGTHYKEIYLVCKAKCQIAVDLSFLPKLELLTG